MPMPVSRTVIRAAPSSLATATETVPVSALFGAAFGDNGFMDL